MSTDLTILDSKDAAIITKAEVDTQIATAKAYPRSAKKSYEEAVFMATMDKEVAESCTFSLPIGKSITGPSIRLAEIMMYAWGNLRIAARILEVNSDYVIVQGTCWDLEKNHAIDAPVRRKVERKRSGEPSEFLINNAVNAAISIAIRNAIFRSIPKALVNKVYEEAMKVAFNNNNGTSLSDIAKRGIDWFMKAGIPALRIYNYFEIKGIDEITNEHIKVMAGCRNAIMEKQLSLDDAFQSEATNKQDLLQAAKDLNNQIMGD